MYNSHKTYDLEDRTSKFGQNTIILCKQIKQDVISRPIINQLVRSSTSVGANYAEANGASSKKDFRNKVHIVKKELQETRHWFKMLNTVDATLDLTKLTQECHELILIFQAITAKLK